MKQKTDCDQRFFGVVHIWRHGREMIVKVNLDSEQGVKKNGSMIAPKESAKDSQVSQYESFS